MPLPICQNVCHSFKPANSNACFLLITYLKILAKDEQASILYRRELGAILHEQTAKDEDCK